MDKLLTPTEVAEILGLQPSTLQFWRKKRKGPPHIRVGHRTVRYPETEFRAWLSTR
jgi:excisionase family DNA binding protein